MYFKDLCASHIKQTHIDSLQRYQVAGYRGTVTDLTQLHLEYGVQLSDDKGGQWGDDKSL